MKQKGTSLKRCISRAEKFISENSICLLLFDVKNSREFKDRNKLQKIIKKMMEDLNYQFRNYLPENNLAVFSQKEKGFQKLLGDGSWAGINSPQIILKIVQYQKKTYPQIPLYWNIAKNGYDGKNTQIVR